MLKLRSARLGRQSGVTLVEVLVTMLIVAFGLLGLAGMQVRAQQATYESYQRAQAVLLLSGITEKINANRPNAGNYVSASTVGAGDSQTATCGALAIGAARDLCEWSNSLKGANEKQTSSGSSVGAMIDARGCITQTQAMDLLTCKPAVYLVTIAWQGLFPTAASANVCAQNLYGSDDSQRRVISSQITIGLTTCAP